MTLQWNLSHRDGTQWKIHILEYCGKCLYENTVENILDENTVENVTYWNTVGRALYWSIEQYVSYWKWKMSDTYWNVVENFRGKCLILGYSAICPILEYI